ncbi:MAG: NUDIX domain-containing protein [Lysobacterales bacterium]|nr:MAG: NUDIX domain-containing protein [Xanthomonadales bacterium]
MSSDRYLDLARRLHALARTGLHFTRDEYDRERYVEIEFIAAGLLAGNEPAGRDALLAIWREERGYVTPKIEVRGAAFREGRVLMVRETADGLWTLPGGWVDVNESPSQAIEKEIGQESGFRARAVKLAALWDRARHGHGPTLHHGWKAFFLCEIEGGEPRGSYETDAVEFFDPDDLPPMSLARSTPRQVSRMLDHWRDWQGGRQLPTDFD